MTTKPVTPAPPAAAGLVRAKEWASRAFHVFLLERAKMPFAWGTNDCALFAADGILAVTGVDIAADFRGKYTDEVSALAAIKTVCGGATVADAAEYCAQKHSLGEWAHPLKAQRGDLAVVMESGRPIAGLVHLNGRDVVSVGERGLLRIPITQIVRAWHVGPPETVSRIWHVRAAGALPLKPAAAAPANLSGAKHV